VVEARQTASCELCHGGSTAYNVVESYRSSLHGIADFAGGSDSVGGDSVAPTCAYCHMQVAQDGNGKLAATHDVGLGIGSKDIDEDDGCAVIPERREVMKKVCSSCHIKDFVANFFDQYQAECEWVRKKWQIPAKNLYCLALAALREIEGEGYVGNTHPIDYLYLQYTNRLKQATRAASMMSPRYTDQSNLTLAKLWFGELVPELREIVERVEPAVASADGSAVGKLRAQLERILAGSGYGHGWPLGDLGSCGDATPKP
jgi:formate-dependent nitrite reductase cytochrome c552 subunit